MTSTHAAEVVELRKDLSVIWGLLSFISADLEVEKIETLTVDDLERIHSEVHIIQRRADGAADKLQRMRNGWSVELAGLKN